MAPSTRRTGTPTEFHPLRTMPSGHRGTTLAMSGLTASSKVGFTMNDISEIEHLRARVAELEAERAGIAGAPRAVEGPHRRPPWRGAASAILIVLACLLAPLSVASVWASTELADTERYVETVAPLADDPAVQEALALEVTTTVFESLDIEGFTREALTTVARQPNVPPRIADALPALAVPLADGVESFTRDQVDTLIAGPEFSQLWAEVNRVAHEQVVTLLEGNQGGAVSAQDTTITLNLGPIVAAVKERLVDRGFELANSIPAVDRSFVLAESDAISQAQGIYRLLNTLGLWLPFVTLALFVAGVFLAGDRRRALAKGALGIAGAMLALGVVLTLARLWYVETTPAGILTADAAGSVFDTLVRFLRSSLRALGVTGLLVALAAFLAGPSAAAVRTRATFEHGIGSARSGAESAGWDSGRTGSWTFAHRRALQIGALVLAGLVLMFWEQPTVWVVVWVTLAVVLALALVELVGRPPSPAAVPPTDSDDEPTVPLPQAVAEP